MAFELITLNKIERIKDNIEHSRDCFCCRNYNYIDKYGCAKGLDYSFNYMNCPYYEDNGCYGDFFMNKTNEYDTRKFDLDFYQLMKPIANMILWEYGLKLVGDTDNYTLDCFNYKMFRNKLMEELKYSLEEGE